MIDQQQQLIEIAFLAGGIVDEVVSQHRSMSQQELCQYLVKNNFDGSMETLLEPCRAKLRSQLWNQIEPDTDIKSQQICTAVVEAALDRAEDLISDIVDSKMHINEFKRLSALGPDKICPIQYAKARRCISRNRAKTEEGKTLNKQAAASLRKARKLVNRVDYLRRHPPTLK